MAKPKKRSDKRSVIGKTKELEKTIIPNENLTVPYGPVTLTRMTFEMLEMDRVLSKLKRDQGVTISEVCIALVAHAMQMMGLSINRMEDLIEDKDMRLVYGLSDEVDKNDLYRTGKALGNAIDPIIRHIDTILKEKLGLRFEEVYLDWSESYNETAFLAARDDGTVSVVYTYRNTGRSIRTHLNAHSGTCDAVIAHHTFKGRYYSDPDRNTHGVLDLSKE